MATIVRHRKVNIVILEAGEAIASFCAPGRTVTKLDAMKTKQDSASTGNDSSNVR